MAAVHQILEARPNDALDEEFRNLPEDADEATRQALAEQIAPFMDTATGANPVTLEPKARTPRQTRAARSVAGHALEALYSRAQLDVLRRAHQISTAGANTCSALD
ncbi:hypothetical protein AB0I61_23490 [Polymorphospora rubra]|uniref:hypothetical protein n=1 Tax=Polymorphospora rubra TaxID=338584 RepID=UPI0034093652